MSSIYVCQDSQDWILKILGEDILKGFEKLGWTCHSGRYAGYDGEDVALHMWWRTAQPYKAARCNAVFITHTDDIYKENDLVRMKDDFDAYFCMSEEDGRFLVELGYDPAKVFGFALPVRNHYVRPLQIGIFSRCYSDKRKNEDWLVNYCASHPDATLVNFVFIGAGWARVVESLSALGCSFSWHDISRKLPYEYFHQQLMLKDLDYYLYMGMDGGAMGTYDAYAMGVPLFVTDDGYHKEIPDQEYGYVDYDSFSSQLDEIIARQRHRIDFFSSHDVDHYVARVAAVLDPSAGPEQAAPHSQKNSSSLPSGAAVRCGNAPSEQPAPGPAGSVLEKRRKGYFNSLRRFNRQFEMAWKRLINRIRFRRAH